MLIFFYYFWWLILICTISSGQICIPVCSPLKLASKQIVREILGQTGGVRGELESGVQSEGILHGRTEPASNASFEIVGRHGQQFIFLIGEVSLQCKLRSCLAKLWQVTWGFWAYKLPIILSQSISGCYNWNIHFSR